MTRLLVVASGTTSPLSTAGPVPVDGQPEWWRCKAVDDGARWRDDPDAAPCEDCVPDGPFPFTVARWEEVECCGPTAGHWITCSTEGIGGAVTALVEVVGPSHHAIQARAVGNTLDHVSEWRACCNAEPDCWHTPTGKVTVLDVPIPCERPPAWTNCESIDCPERHPHEHGADAESWWTELPSGGDGVSRDVGTYPWLVESLLRLHQPRTVKGVRGQTNDETYCRECSRGWPCRTAQLSGVPETVEVQP